MNRIALCAGVFLSISLLAGTAGPARAQDNTITETDIINGTMDIDFKTRQSHDTSGKYEEGAPEMNVQDKYIMTLTVAKTTEFAGNIVRQPNIFTKTMRKRVQGAAIRYDLNMAVMKPDDLKQKKTIGKWVGLMPIDTGSGAYDLGGGRNEKPEPSPLRIKVEAIGKASAFEDFFGGKLMGKAEKKEDLASYTYKRLIGEKTVQIVAKKVDPMRFEGVELAKGPVEIYPHCIVNGRLDYDYETSNWYTDGIRFKYNLNGKDFEDVVTGSIKWVEDPNHATNGKGQYEFNLRYNEAANKKAGGESAAFEKMSDEDAFFFVDDATPALTGSISYVDTAASGSDAPVASKITYHLNANKLTKQQVMNFFKLWLICVGPTNDE